MVDEGYDFLDDDEEDESPEVSDKDIPVKYKNINEITNERNKIAYETNSDTKEVKERIGKLNLDLFGDPRNSEWLSKIEKMEKVIDDPMTSRHPIAQHARDLIDGFKELQFTHDKLQGIYSSGIKRIGDLLDNAIKFFLKMESVYQTQLSKLKQPKQTVKPKVITKGVVQSFMDSHGHKLFNMYNEAYDNGNFRETKRLKEEFVIKAKIYFEDYPDSEHVGNKLFDKFTKERPLREELVLANLKKEEPPSDISEPAKEEV